MSGSKSRSTEIIDLDELAVQKQSGHWQSPLTLRVFGKEMSTAAPPADLASLVDGLLHALSTLQMAATNPACFSSVQNNVQKVEEDVALCLSLLSTWGRRWKPESLVTEVRRLVLSMGNLSSWSTSMLCPPSPFLHTWLEVRCCLLRLLAPEVPGLLAHEVPAVSDLGVLLPPSLPCPSLLAATLIDLIHLSK